MLDTPPKTSIFGHLRVKVDQLTQGEGYGRAINLSRRSRSYTLYGNPHAFEGQG